MQFEDFPLVVDMDSLFLFRSISSLPPPFVVLDGDCGGLIVALINFGFYEAL